MLTAPRLNTRNRVTDGLVFLAVGGYPFDLVSGRKGTLAGSTASLLGVSKYGGAFESTVSNGTMNISWPDTTVARALGTPTTQHTMMILADYDAVSANGHAITIPWDGTLNPPYFSLAMQEDGGGTGGLEVDYAIVGLLQTYIPAGTFWQTGLHSYAWTRNNATNIVYRDGAQFASDGAGTTGSVDFNGSATEIVINDAFSVALGPGSDSSNDGRVYFAAIWARALTLSEVKSLNDNPAQMWTTPKLVALPVRLPPAVVAGAYIPPAITITRQAVNRATLN